jgi:hypothetical protein
LQPLYTWNYFVWRNVVFKKKKKNKKNKKQTNKQTKNPNKQTVRYRENFVGRNSKI